MKKIISLFLVVILSTTLMACSFGSKTIDSISVVPGSYEDQYMLNDSYDFSTLKVIVRYNDNSIKEIPFDELEVGEIDTSTPGVKQLEISYGSKTINVSINVYSTLDEMYEIVGFEIPEFVQENISAKKEKEEKEAEFYVRDNPYIVGDDNPFKFFPNLTVLDENGVPVSVNSYQSISTLYVFNATANEYQKIDAEYLSRYVEIDEEKSTYDFTEEAINHYFKLSVRPKNLREYQDEEDFTITFEFKVVDGWNAYNVADLSRINNDPDEEYIEIWASYKLNNNIGYEKINGMVLHSSLTITMDDIPDGYKFLETDDNVVSASSITDPDEYQTKRVIGTIRDCEDIYHRFIDEGERFDFYGNYFTIDIRQLSIVSEYGQDGSNTSLFKFETPEDGNYDAHVDGAIYDLNLLGNAGKEQNETNMGGLIGIKMKSDFAKADYEIDNVILKNFFINIMPEYESVTYTISNVKSYDTFGNSAFIDRPGVATITNSEFKRSGGPLMVVQYKYDELFPNANINFEIDESTVMESWLTGKESWFVSYGYEDSWTYIVALNGTFNVQGKVKGFVNNSKVNVLFAVVKQSSEWPDKEPSLPLVKIEVGEKVVVDTMNTENPYYSIMLGMQSAPLFVNSEGDWAFYNGSFLTRDGSTPIASDDDLFSRGEYITLYQGGSAYVMGYNTTKVEE